MLVTPVELSVLLETLSRWRRRLKNMTPSCPKTTVCSTFVGHRLKLALQTIQLSQMRMRLKTKCFFGVLTLFLCFCCSTVCLVDSSSFLLAETCCCRVASAFSFSFTLWQRPTKIFTILLPPFKWNGRGSVDPWIEYTSPNRVHSVDWVFSPYLTAWVCYGVILWGVPLTSLTEVSSSSSLLVWL